MAVPEPRKVDSEIQERAPSGPDLANRPSETTIRELRSKRRADNLTSIPPSTSEGEARIASLNLLASMALEEDQHAEEPSVPFVRREGKEQVVSDEEDDFWQECGQFFVEQDSEDEETVDTEKGNRDEEEEEDEECGVESPLSPAKMPIPQWFTRSTLKWKHTATSVGGPAAKRVKKVIVIDFDEVTDHSDSDSKGPENKEGVEEAGVEETEEEEVEEEEGVAANNEQVNAREVIQYNIRAQSPFWENGFSAAFKHPPFIKQIIDHYGWHNLCQQPEGTSEGMVRAFYRNFDEEEFTSEV